MIMPFQNTYANSSSMIRSLSSLRQRHHPPPAAAARGGPSSTSTSTSTTSQGADGGGHPTRTSTSKTSTIIAHKPMVRMIRRKRVSRLSRFRSYYYFWPRITTMFLLVLLLVVVSLLVATAAGGGAVYYYYYLLATSTLATTTTPGGGSSGGVLLLHRPTTPVVQLPSLVYYHNVYDNDDRWPPPYGKSYIHQEEEHEHHHHGRALPSAAVDEEGEETAAVLVVPESTSLLRGGGATGGSPAEQEEYDDKDDAYYSYSIVFPKKHHSQQQSGGESRSTTRTFRTPSSSVLQRSPSMVTMRRGMPARDFGGLEDLTEDRTPGAERIIQEGSPPDEEDENDEDEDHDGWIRIPAEERKAAEYFLDDDFQEAVRATREHLGLSSSFSQQDNSEEEEGDGDDKVVLEKDHQHDRSEDDEDDADNMNCRKVQEYRMGFPTCNEMHQLDHSGGNVLASGYGYINHGYFRDVFSINHRYRDDDQYHQDEDSSSASSDHNQEDHHHHHHHHHQDHDRLAIKQIRYEDSSADIEYYEYVRVDAYVAERLTASPRTFDIYGYCGLSILSEFFYHGDIEARAMTDENDGYINPADLNDEEDVDPKNDLTPEQKLVLGLEMAEGLADLHGYANALILHSDVQMSQFLLNRDKTMLKLNDFNRAELPLWDEATGQYCRFRAGKGHGTWRSPEEYQDEPLTEAIDVWSLGNNLFALLTGLNPLFDINGGPIKERIMDGETGYIDPRYATRSKAEGALVSVIKKCFEYYAKDRATIFEVVQELRQAVSELGISRDAVLKDL